MDLCVWEVTEGGHRRGLFLLFDFFFFTKVSSSFLKMISGIICYTFLSFGSPNKYIVSHLQGYKCLFSILDRSLIMRFLNVSIPPPPLPNIH